MTLSNFSHAFANDMRALLVGPSGQTTELIGGGGGGVAAGSVTLTLDDAASAPSPIPTTSAS